MTASGVIDFLTGTAGCLVLEAAPSASPGGSLVALTPLAASLRSRLLCAGGTNYLIVTFKPSAPVNKLLSFNYLMSSFFIDKNMIPNFLQSV
jgi:hypothetical protein